MQEFPIFTAGIFFFTFSHTIGAVLIRNIGFQISLYFNKLLVFFITPVYISIKIAVKTRR